VVTPEPFLANFNQTPSELACSASSHASHSTGEASWRIGLPSFPVSLGTASVSRESPIKTAVPGADDRTVRATILGSFGVLWGGAIVAGGLLDRTASPDASTAIGELMALAVGALLLAVGARTLVRRFL
jgi:hypothetical protein